jgi:hypothetical protein
MTSARIRKQRKARRGPSAPRVIGANDNHLPGANDNAAVVVKGVTLTQNQAIRFANAQANIASGDLNRQRLGLRVMEELEQEIEARRNAEVVDEALSERRGLEALRGYQIGTSTVEGAVGAPKITRDGLETLLTAKALTLIQHAAGLRYRTDYEAIDPEKGLTPPSIDQTRNIVRGGDGYAQKRREIEERVFGIHCMIAGVEPPRDGSRAAMPNLPAGHPAMRAIYALNEIAGKGANVLDLATSGSVRARIREDLIFGLDACAIVYGLE